MKKFTNSGQFKKGHKKGMTGKHHSVLTKLKIKKANTGYIHSEEAKEKNRKWHIGKRTGKDNNMWKGGITPANTKIRNSDEYKLWRKSVFERDGYQCQVCEQVGGVLNAHHIKEFSNYPELRLAIDNGITLCKSCHKIETDNRMIGNKYAKKIIIK